MQLIEQQGGNSTHHTYCFTLVVNGAGCNHTCCQADLNKIEVCPDCDSRVTGIALTPAWGVEYSGPACGYNMGSGMWQPQF